MQMQFSLFAEELSGMSKVHCWLGAVNLYYLSMNIPSSVGMFLYTSFGFFLSHIFSWESFLVRVFFPWLHLPCNLWCHWLSFCLAHPNKCFAVILYRALDMLFYGIIQHAYIAPYCYAYCIGTGHYIFCQCPHVAWPKPMVCQLPGPSLWYVSCLSARCTSNERHWNGSWGSTMKEEGLANEDLLLQHQIQWILRYKQSLMSCTSMQLNTHWHITVIKYVCVCVIP